MRAWQVEDQSALRLQNAIRVQWLRRDARRETQGSEKALKFFDSGPTAALASRTLLPRGGMGGGAQAKQPPQLPPMPESAEARDGTAAAPPVRDEAAEANAALGSRTLSEAMALIDQTLESMRSLAGPPTDSASPADAPDIAPLPAPSLPHEVQVPSVRLPSISA